MKIEKKNNDNLVKFGDLDAGVVFTCPDYGDMVFMTCYDVRDYEYPEESNILNALVLDDDDPGSVVHFDDADMVRPYYNCKLTLAD
jgi:hypothetical protein